MATAIEYGLIAALVGVVAISAVTVVGNFDAEEQAEAARAEMPAPLSFGTADSPVITMTPGGPVVSCPEGYSFVQRARPADAPETMSCELVAERP